MNPRLNTLDDLVKPEKGLIGRRIFVDQEIFEAEMREIFAKAWLFVGHESLVPNPDDYFISRMGTGSVFSCHSHAKATVSTATATITAIQSRRYRGKRGRGVIPAVSRTRSPRRAR